MLRTRQLLILIVLTVLLYLSDRVGIISPVTGSIDTVVTTLKTLIYQTVEPVHIIAELITNNLDMSKVPHQISKLSQKNQELQSEVGLLTDENKSLRRQLSAPLPAAYQFVPAIVISKSRYMEVAAGVRVGIKEEMPVVDGSTLIGKVEKVAKDRSQILLLGDADLAVTAKTSRGTKGKIIGQAGNTVLLDRILQKDPLFLGDSVVTSGEDGFPPNLIIGKVTHITSSDVAVYKQAKLDITADYPDLTTVFIISSL